MLLVVLFSVNAYSMQLPETLNLNVPNMVPNADVDFDLNSEPDTVVDTDDDGQNDIADLDFAIEQYELIDHGTNIEN